MAIAAGQKLGTYQVLGSIGAGGQGEVYRAHDSVLKRDVAIKVLPESLAAESDRIARFHREAELLASLSHSNIAIVHDFQQVTGRHFLVMEFVEGESLADRLKRGPIPVDETLHLAKQVAEALDAAHQKGITHRDLKPANIKITPDGKVKVLDFGLAKMFESATTSEMSNSPTLMSATSGGVILGTAAYMSPEQARGRVIDKRTDIWALGCVIYEALTGKQAFAGDNISDTIAAILRGEPEWTALPADTPRRLRVLLERCLHKDPHQRLHDAADVRIAIEDAGKPEVQTAIPAPRDKPFPAVAFAAAILVTSVLTSMVWFIRGRSTSVAPIPMHLSLKLAPGAPTYANSWLNLTFAVSPDGKWIAYNAENKGAHPLYLQDIRKSGGRFISGTEDAIRPFFSPDSQWIAFAAGNTLKKVPVTGGSPIEICDLPTAASGLTAFDSGTWGSDNRIVFVPAFNAGMYSVPADGGKPELLLNTDEAKDLIAFLQPQVLPDKKGILFTLASGHAFSVDDVQIAILEPGATEPRVLIRGGYKGHYVPTGHLIYTHRGAILAVPFDLARLALAGTPLSVTDGLEMDSNGNAYYEVSDNGMLVYEPHGGIEAGTRLVTVDRRGNVRPISDGRGSPIDFSVSPDGKKVAAEVMAVNNDVWIYDAADGTSMRLTSEPGDEGAPQWTFDGRRIAFGSRIGRMFWKSSDGAGQREEFPRGEFPRFPSSFSPDGKLLAFDEVHPSTKTDIWLLPLSGDRKAQPFLNTEADEKTAKFSPNGGWLAYVSDDETGRDEVYVKTIGSSGARKRISTGGGSWPTWNRNGRELFFLKGDKLAAATLDAEMNRVGQERIILDAPKFGNLQFQADTPYYDVMPDGDHFVMLLKPQYPSPTHYNVVVNWFEELKRR